MTLAFDDTAPAVELRDVHKAFGPKQVLRGVDLRVPVGQTLTLLGGSGSGKSVCLKHMIGLLRPDAGSVRVGSVEIGPLGERELVAVRKRFGMLFQTGALFDSLTVFENIAYPLREHLDLSEAELGQRVAECLEAVALPGIEGLLPDALSGGMRKRVGLARAVALRPEIVLYDEPTTGLDPVNAHRIGELILDLKRRLGVTSVVVTHDLEICFAVSDRVAFLHEGRVVEEGSPTQIRSASRPELRTFLEGFHDTEPPGTRAGSAKETPHGT